ncbi:hypothetical protein EI555_013733, partial [Monodon monoceros]
MAGIDQSDFHLLGRPQMNSTPWLEEALDTDQGQRVLRSSTQSTQRRQSALSPADPPTGKHARRAEALSPAVRTGPHNVGRSRPRCCSAASPSDHGPSVASGTLAVDMKPTPAWGPGSPPSPSGTHHPAAAAPQRAQDPCHSQTTQGHGPQLGQPLHAALPHRLLWHIAGPWRQPHHPLRTG